MYKNACALQAQKESAEVLEFYPPYLTLDILFHNYKK